MKSFKTFDNPVSSLWFHKKEYTAKLNYISKRLIYVYKSKMLKNFKEQIF